MRALELAPVGAERRFRRRRRMRPVHDRVDETDEALLARVARGDREAFARVFGALRARR